MELYELARTDLMVGKKILYVHGFASSGSTGTVKTMRVLLPKAEVIAPDLPVDPHEAMALLNDICQKENPSLIIGTSMGGMYTELLKGYDRIVVNPAFHLADTILKNNGLGRQEFHNPRKDGQTSFLVNKGLLEDFRDVSSKCFQNVEEDKGEVWGLFGLKDNLVNCFDEFYSHYSNALHFDGEHYLNDHTFIHSVLPVIQRIDDRQEGRQKRTVLIALEDITISNGGVKAFRTLSQWYDVYALSGITHNVAQSLPEKIKAADELLGVYVWNKVILTSHKDLLLADYLVDSKCEQDGGENFMGTSIKYGEDPFKTWDEVITYFERLGGQ